MATFDKLKNWLLVRGLELLPGLFTWVVLIGLFVGSFFVPDIVASFIILFNVFWVIRSINDFLNYTKSYVKFQAWKVIDWSELYYALESKKRIQTKLQELQSKVRSMTLKAFYKANYEIGNRFLKLPFLFSIPVLWLEKRYLIRFLRNEISHFDSYDEDSILFAPKDLIHVVIIPFATEPYEVLERSVGKLAAQTIDTNQMVLVLATEKLCPEGFEVAEKLVDKYSDKFKKIWITKHPLKEDEVQGKSSNMWYAAVQAREKIEKLGWNKDLITMTSCDCDSQFPPEYFGMLGYHFSKHTNRYKKYWHGSMDYTGNIWEVPAFVRVPSSIFSIYSFSRPERKDFIQVSTYSASYRLLESIGFWSKDLIPEDYHMFFKALFEYGEEVETVPMYVRIIGDAPISTNIIKTFKAQYQQVMRWSWGVSDDPWMLRNIFSKGDTFKERLYVIWRTLAAVFDHFMWPLYGIVLGIGANIPPLVSQRFSYTVYGRALPRVSSTILTVSTVFWFVSVVLEFTIRRNPPEGKKNVFRKFVYIIEYALMMITGPIFGSLPAVEATTRLLLNKRLEKHVATEKK
jgi:hypothetical protein